MIISKKLRAAAAGAVSLALLVGGAANAFAAPGDVLNPQSNGSKGSFYLWDANTGEFADGDASRIYGKSDAVIASANSTDVLSEINPSATRPVTGATPFTGVYHFISDKNATALAGGLNTWKAASTDVAAGPNGGVLTADMTLENVQGVDALITSGGSFWYGIAFTTNNGVTTIGAIYREINITAVSGNYTLGAVEVEAAGATDVATTTTLSADKATAEAGTNVTLSATVTSTPDATGNVQFLDGATVIGTVGVVPGAETVTKSVTASVAGDHTYSAKFVENTVGSSKFLASTSSDVVVSFTTPPAPAVPNAPSLNSLNAASANSATAAYDATTHKATLTVPASVNGATVNTFVYSAPIFLGQVTVAGGSVSFDVSVLPAGTHTMVIVDTTSGSILGWATFTKSDAAIAPSFSKTINADVANTSSVPSDGEFSLKNLSGDTVNLTNPTIVNNKSVVSGQLGDFKVTDMRVVTKAGWTLKTDVAQFAHGTDTIANSALGIAPVVVSQTAGTAPVLGAAQVSGSAIYPWNFATLASGSYSGVSTYNADLVFTAPVNTPAGTYTSTLTLTLISG